jgi:membrane protease subunit HflK
MMRRLSWKKWVLGIFNLNDPRWGRHTGKEGQDGASASGGPNSVPPSNKPPSGSGSGSGSGSDRPGQERELEDIWNQFAEKLRHTLSAQRSKNRMKYPLGAGGHQNGGKKLSGVLVFLLLMWMVTGFYVVQEGQQAVITRFGQFLGPEKGLAGAGMNWHIPYPIEDHEIVDLSRLRSVEIGRGQSILGGAGNVNGSNGNNGMGGGVWRHSLMLTQDENIVDVRFVVQYRLKSAVDYLYNQSDPDLAVELAAESAVREVVGKVSMNVVLNEKREAIAVDIAQSIQTQLDAYRTGILIASVNIQNVQPPEQVQAAFDDALKAGQDGDRAKNEGLAYANEVLPRAQGASARLHEEAQAYAARVVAQAEGDAHRFKAVLVQYKKAPRVTRDRMYIDAMQQIYTSTNKVVVDTQNHTWLNLPLEKILQLTANNGEGSVSSSTNSSGSVSGSLGGGTGMGTALPGTPGASFTQGVAAGAGENMGLRSREGQRSREFEWR